MTFPPPSFLPMVGGMFIVRFLLLALLLGSCTVGPGPLPASSPGLSEFVYPPAEERDPRTEWVWVDGSWVKTFEPSGWVWECFEGGCAWVWYPVPHDGWVYVWGKGWVEVGPTLGMPLGNPGDPPNGGQPPFLLN